MSAAPYPIRITALRARDFRGLRGEFELDFDRGLTLIVGENGAGKSSILNAIEWALFGAEVTKKSSGIDERADFEVRHRSAEGEVSVTLELAVDGGTARLRRARLADAKKTAPDELSLELPNGETLEGDEVRAWMEWNRLPDWSEWKHAFCQHQELLRARVTDAGERSTQLARLLGLGEFQDWTTKLRGLKPGRLKKAATEELERVEEEFKHAIEAPGLALREVEDELEERGVGRTELNDAWLAARLEKQVDEARRLTDKLALALEVPEAKTLELESWSRWSRDWERLAQEGCRGLERELGTLRTRIGELESTLNGMEPARRAFEDAQRAWESETQEHGGKEQLGAQLADLAKERAAQVEREKGRNATVALLRHAVEEMERRATGSDCPVCETPLPELREKLVARVEREGGDDERVAREALHARQAQLERQQATTAERRSALDLAKSNFESLGSRLERFVGAGSDPTRAAEEKRREWMKRVESLETVLDESRRFLESGRDERALLELFGRWRTAGNQTEAAAGDLGRVRAWVELQTAIDEAASLKVDLETLATMARAVQESRSREQVERVNATLGTHTDTISPGAGLRVAVKATATQLKYKLVDASGQDAASILNQAALHAVSFAVLFAQAEARAAEGAPSWVMLDDPGQSLDEERIHGLARVIGSVSEKVSVLVATFPGALEAALRRQPNCRVVELGAARVQAGVVIRSVTEGSNP